MEQTSPDESSLGSKPVDQSENGSLANLARQTAVRVEQIFTDLPMAYKRWADYSDLQLVLAGLKAGTDYLFAGSTYQENEFQQFKQILSKFGLRLSPLRLTYAAKGKPVRSGLIYNPAALIRETANSKFAPPYDSVELIEDYESRAVRLGYSIHGVAGKIYSFPESAIADYVATQEKNGEKPALERERKSTGNEVYWYYPPAKEDVINRERMKEAFFRELQKTPEMQRVEKSQDLEKSNKEWIERFHSMP